MARPFPRPVARSWRAYRSLRSGAGHSRVGQSPSIAPYVQELLRARHDRPSRRRTAEQRDELAAADHSITSSASASTLSGIVMPSALALLRLMAISNFVGCSTGRSAGFSPLRILPV